MAAPFALLCFALSCLALPWLALISALAVLAKLGMLNMLGMFHCWRLPLLAALPAARHSSWPLPSLLFARPRSLPLPAAPNAGRERAHDEAGRAGWRKVAGGAGCALASQPASSARLLRSSPLPSQSNACPTSQPARQPALTHCRPNGAYLDHFRALASQLPAACCQAPLPAARPGSAALERPAGRLDGSLLASWPPSAREDIAFS